MINRDFKLKSTEKHHPEVDIRVQHFLWLFPLGFLSHGMSWIIRRGDSDFLFWTERELWSPGVFLPMEWNLFLNWIVWFALALYLSVGKYKRPAAIALGVLTVTHFLHLFSRVPNHFLLILIPAVLLGLCPFKSSKGTPLLVKLLRMLVIMTYAFAVLHKLNPVYFSSESAIISFFQPFLENLGLDMPPSFWPWLAFLGVINEILIPICLLRKNWRAYGFYLGFLFHGMIAALGASDYSIVICALYPVFLDKNESQALFKQIFLPSKSRKWFALLQQSSALISFVSLWIQDFSYYPNFN